MIADYQRKANIAAGIWLLSLVGALAAMPLTNGSNVWEASNPLPPIIFSLNGIAFFYAFWAYAKAKGYSGAIGLLLPLLSLIGLIILVVLKDKHPVSK